MITCALIYGFDSPEHDVSVMTALEIIRNAPSIGVRLKPIYARDGHFYGGDELTEVAAYTPFDRTAHREVLISGGKLWQIKRGKAKIECDLDVALIAAHGGEGENGALQGFLEIAGIPYFSTGVFGSALGMNKAATKTLLSAKGVPVSEWVTLKRGEDHRKIFESIAYPVIIKPNSGGSSLGIYVADSAAEAVGMAAKAFECDPDFDELIVEKYLVGADDVNSNADPAVRRGVAGIFFMYKCAGAKAAKGGTLDEVLAAAQKAKDNTRTVGFALTPCIIPEVGHPNFTLGENEMAMGMGIHGEPGVWNGPIKTADELAKESLDTLLGDMPVAAGEEVCLLINGLGATSVEELYILCNSVRKILDEKGVKVYRTFVGEYATSMEMAGASISICRMADDEMKEQIDMPVKTPFYTQA